MSKFKVIVDIKLQYEVNAIDENDAIFQVENVELPKEYKEDSFEIDKVERI